MPKVRLLTGLVGAVAYNAGDDFECGEAEAVRLIEAGFAAKIETATTKPVMERAVKFDPLDHDGDGRKGGSKPRKNKDA
jgi:hypothetical protein